MAYIIKEAKAKCEHWLYEHALMNKANSTLAIFSLKANYKWRDGNNEREEPFINEERGITPEEVEKIREVVGRNGDYGK